MKNFFIPQSWGEKLEVFAFKPIRNMWNAATSSKKDVVAVTPSQMSSSSSRKRKRRNGSKTTMTDVEPGSKSKIERVGVTATDESTTRLKKVRSGRVEKKRSAKNSKSDLMALKKSLTSTIAAKELSEKSIKTVKKRSKSKANLPLVAESSKKPPAMSLKDRLKETLLGGRFRFLNEQLYTRDSQSAERLFREDGDAFNAYHEGYRHQVERWPLNPLNRIVQMIRSLPKSLEIADFGCGEGKLAKLVPNKVFSLDLVSTRPDIIACDMANTPLKSESIDVVVYCLSLMGTNLKDYILEANRVLRMGGLVYIAEIQSRFEDERSFIRGLEACGFKLVKKDVSKKLFYFFQFKKLRNVGKVAVLPAFTLKPCLYRRR